MLNTTHVGVQVFIDTLRVKFLAIGNMKKWYSSANLGIQVLGISKTLLFLHLLLKPIEWFSLRFLGKNNVSIMVRHLWSLTLQLWINLFLAHSLRGMKLTFNLPAINSWILWARSTFWRRIILMVPYYLGSFLINLNICFIKYLHFLLLVKGCIDEWFI